jgi:hypothetical protein
MKRRQVVRAVLQSCLLGCVAAPWVVSAQPEVLTITEDDLAARSHRLLEVPAGGGTASALNVTGVTIHTPWAEWIEVQEKDGAVEEKR